MNKRVLWADGLLLLAAIIWGCGFVVTKNTLEHVGSLYTIAFRFTFAGVCALLVFGKSLRGLKGADLLRCLLVGLLLYTAFAFQTVGMAHTTPGKNAFLTTTYVVLVPLLCWPVLGARPRASHLWAAGLALLGIALISLDSSLSLGLGDGLSIICGLFFALHILMVDRTQRTADVRAVITLQFVVCALLGWVLAPLVEPSPFPLSAPAWGGLLYLGVVSSLVGFSLQLFGQKWAPPTHAAILLSLEAVFGCLASFLFLGEVFSPRMLLGCGVMLTAVLISELRR